MGPVLRQVSTVVDGPLKYFAATIITVALAMRRSSFPSKAKIVVSVLSAALLLLSIGGGLRYLSPVPNGFALSTTSSSWNPSVGCTASVVTIEQVLGGQANSMGGATQSGSMFNPGITSPVGEAKRWLTPGPTPPGWVSPGPPCTITNANGQVVSAFVEIHRIQRLYLLNEDYAVQYDPVNGGGSYPTGMNLSDTTTNMFTPGYTTCSSTNMTGCMHTVHIEFDHDWKAGGYCGPNTACNPYAMAQATPAEPSSNCQKTPVPAACYIDIQGFVYWDPEHVNSSYHSFSGWEIHPLTAWRISSGSPPPEDFSLTANPNSLQTLPSQSTSSTFTLTSINSFSGTVSLSASVVPTSSSSGPTPTVAASPSSVTVSVDGTANSTIDVATAPSDEGNYTVMVTGVSGNLTESVSITLSIVDFGVTANPDSLTVPIASSGQSTVTLTSVNGFSGSVNLTASVSPTNVPLGLTLSSPSASLSASSVELSLGSNGTTTLTVSTSVLTTPGTYAITISASSSGIIHTAIVTVTVTLL